MFERFTQRCREIMAKTNVVAHASGDGILLPRHLLQAMVQTPDSIAGRIIAMCGQPSLGTPAAHGDRIAASPKLKELIEFAVKHARTRGEDFVGSEHLLLGLIDVSDPDCSSTLAAIGLTHARASELIDEARRQQKGNA
jgi:ATP-dependent Clp protease ATP-binding subunit ClpC